MVSLLQSTKKYPPLHRYNPQRKCSQKNTPSLHRFFATIHQKMPYEQKRSILVLFWPFWGPRGYRNGPRVVQHDIHSCNIPMGSVLGSFGAFQGNIWSVAPFIPVRRGQKRVKKHEKRVFSKSPKLMIFSKPVPNYPHFPPKYG